MSIKTKLKNEVWRSDQYILMAQKGSLDTKHIGMKILKDISQKAKNILDLGCGEGTRLNYLLAKETNTTGVDISSSAINMAKKNYPKSRFIQADLEDIPLKKDEFDLVFSAYVLEHLSNPERVLLEAIRLTTPLGYLVLIAPNYGAPNRSSPPFKGSRVKKLLKGILLDIKRKLVDIKTLDWELVEPIADKTKYDIDWDTTIEPYLGSLIQFLKSKGLKIETAISCWSEELPNAKMHQKIFKFLGLHNFYPFWMWGPHLVVVAGK